MKKETIVIPLSFASKEGEYICSDGEVATFSGLLPSSLFMGNSVAADTESGNLTPSGPVTLNLPSPPAVEFNLLRAPLPGWSIAPLSLPSRVFPLTGSSEADLLKVVETSLKALLKDAERYGLFCQPFLILAAWRLPDGSHLSPSSPVLMIPNSLPPIVEAVSQSEEEIRLALTWALCSLQFRCGTLSEEWQGRIAALDIFISPPIPLIDDDALPESVRRVSFEGFSHSMAPDGSAGELPVWEETIAVGWKFPARSDAEINSDILAAESFLLLSSIPAADLPVADFTDTPFNTGASTLTSPFPSYHPDFLQRCKVEAEGSVIFAECRTLFNLTLTPPSPSPLSLLTPFCNLAGYIPRFLFHPDRRACSISASQNGRNLLLPLSPHPGFEGAFLLRGIHDATPLPASVSPYHPEPLRFPDGLWRSAENNFLLFPDASLLTSGLETIVSLSKEGMRRLTLVASGGDFSLTTRALKLGAPECRKRLLSVALRGVFPPANVTIALSASDDLLTWRDIASTHGCLLSPLWGATFRYFRLHASGSLPAGSTLCAISLTLLS